jgi:hypothetical protein
VNNAAHDPVDALLIGGVGVGAVVAAAPSLEVDDRKQREAGIGQHEKVAHRLRRRHCSLVVSQVVEIRDQPEHEHRAEDRPDRLGPRRRQQLGALRRKKRPCGKQ